MAEVIIIASDGVVATTAVEGNEEVLELLSVVVRWPTMLLMVVVVAVVALVLLVTLVTLVFVCVPNSVEVFMDGGSCVGTNDVTTETDSVGEAVMLFTSVCNNSVYGFVVKCAVLAVALERDVKSNVWLAVAPVSSSEAVTVERRDEDTLKTGVV